jgi:hypothetical protein
MATPNKRRNETASTIPSTRNRAIGVLSMRLFNPVGKNKIKARREQIGKIRDSIVDSVERSRACYGLEVSRNCAPLLFWRGGRYPRANRRMGMGLISTRPVDRVFQRPAFKIAIQIFTE